MATPREIVPEQAAVEFVRRAVDRSMRQILDALGLFGVPLPGDLFMRSATHEVVVRELRVVVTDGAGRPKVGPPPVPPKAD